MEWWNYSWCQGMRFFLCLIKTKQNKTILVSGSTYTESTMLITRPHHLHPGSWVAGTASRYSGPMGQRKNCPFSFQDNKVKPSCKTFPACQKGMTLTKRDQRDSKSSVCFMPLETESSARMWKRKERLLNSILCVIKKRKHNKLVVYILVLLFWFSKATACFVMADEILEIWSWFWCEKGLAARSPVPKS